jgi:hypothetical protein
MDFVQSPEDLLPQSKGSATFKDQHEGHRIASHEYDDMSHERQNVSSGPLAIDETDGDAFVIHIQ